MSKRDVGFSLLLALAVTVSMTIKVWHTDYSLALDSGSLTRDLQAKLAAQGFATRYEKRHYQSDVVDATRGNCRLRVRDGAMSNEFGTVFALDSQNLGPIHFIYQGTWYDTPPVFRIQLGRALTHVLARLGVPVRYAPTLAIAARGCDRQHIDFSGLWATWAPRTAAGSHPQP